MKQEKRVSDILIKMSRAELEAVSLMCDYASGYLKTSTPEAVQAARRIHDRMTEEQQKVAYYLIGCARSDFKKPHILSLFI